MRWNHDHHFRRQGFALLEAMLAVAIFAMGILALGRCISQGLSVERIEGEDTRAYHILESRAAEIEAGAVRLVETKEQIGGVNGGMTLTQALAPVHKKDEHGQEMANLSLVTLGAAWTSNGERQSRTLNFYVWSLQP
ncbi:MAG: prepilin-type N-terminal cleavage/methylation domain-containing protein [Chthoniobacter sp.]|uniref:type IV pilus modification PilV family protein n=1 Tax=Chthoniobacter sp. TaxID=2510640 RepID=UPI0032AB079F